MCGMFGIVEPVGAERMRRDVAWNMVPVVLLGVVGLALNFSIASHWERHRSARSTS